MFGAQSDISADRHGMAAGGSINLQGIPPEHLPAILKMVVEGIRAASEPLERRNDELHATIAELQRQLGASQEQVLGFFRIIGGADIPAEAVPARLVEIAERHKALVAQAAP